MNVFIDEVVLENFSLFKAELIYDIVCEMDYDDYIKERIIDSIISSLDEYDYIWRFDVTLASPTFIFLSLVSFLFCLNVNNPVTISPRIIKNIIAFFNLSSPFISYYYIQIFLNGLYRMVVLWKIK